MSCGRHCCPDCGEDLIHRDNRRHWESASAFGQIVWLRGPVRLTTGDIDHYAAVFHRDKPDLLRIIEHKTPRQTLSRVQWKVLRTLALALDSLPLDPRSGVYIVRGEIGRCGDSINFRGPQDVEKFSIALDQFHHVTSLDDDEAVFRWLEGTHNASAAGPRRFKELPAIQELRGKAVREAA